MSTSQRYRFRISYHGGDYCGWQIQPHSPSVQQTIEEKLSLLTNSKVEIVGCGRTDTGVHASDYVFHAQFETGLPPAQLQYKLNSMLPKSIAIHSVEVCDDDFHARYSATSRSYTYLLHFEKDPFKDGLSYFCPYAQQMDIELLRPFADLLMEYEDFATFCKTNSDVQHTRCRIDRVEWITDDYPRTLRFEITANRFLRGMIRLIVGASVNVSRGKLTLDQVKDCLEHQKPLPLAWSAPAEGLYLSEIRY